MGISTEVYVLYPGTKYTTIQEMDKLEGVTVLDSCTGEVSQQMKNNA